MPKKRARPTPRKPDPSDEPQLRLTVQASFQLIQNQYVQGGSLEAQLVGFVAVLFAGLGVLIAIKHLPHDHGWILEAGAGASILVCVFGLLFSGELESGQIPRWFYDESAGMETHEFLDELSMELDRAAENNQDGIERRRGALTLALIVLPVAGVAWILIR